MARATESGPGIDVGELAARAGGLMGMLEGSQDDRARVIRARLEDSVVRPLRTVVDVPEETAGRDDGRPGEEQAGWVAETIWELAELATTARVRSSDVAVLAQAVAALQDLALTLTKDDGEVAHRLGELEALQATLSPRIQCAHDGPYLLTNVPRVVTSASR